MSNQEKVQHDYRLHGDSMQEVYPPEYQEHLDAPEIKTELEQWLDMINENVTTGAPF